ncbi:MAG: hypothetical protein WCC74_02990 [Minisyncoccia bacterium]
MENTQTEPKKYSPVIKWSLVVGIVIVLNLFFNYLISLVYKAPEYNNFCKQEQIMPVANTRDACLTAGGQWSEYNQIDPNTTPAKVIGVTGNCNTQYTCGKNFDVANKSFERNVFVVLVVVGVILVALSFILVFNWIVSVSFSMGGILSIIIASMRYWGNADNLIRVLILFFALVALIYFAIKKFTN